MPDLVNCTHAGTVQVSGYCIIGIIAQWEPPPPVGSENDAICVPSGSVTLEIIRVFPDGEMMLNPPLESVRTILRAVLVPALSVMLKISPGGAVVAHILSDAGSERNKSLCNALLPTERVESCHGLGVEVARTGRSSETVLGVRYRLALILSRK